MKESEEILLQGAKIQGRINSNDKQPRPFGTKQLLYQSEIHFIDAIEPGEGLNASQISRKLGITNGAVTQIADKLVQKELITKYRKDDNRKEIYLKLTEEGVTAFKHHKLFHKELSDKMIEYIDNLNHEQIEGIKGFIEVIEKYLPDLSGKE